MIVRFEHRDENVALQADERDAARPFKTGSRGFNASGKVTIDGKRYQVSCNLIEIGSKPTDRERQEITSSDVGPLHVGE